MNYLAHLFLCECTPESFIGNLLGDFAKGSVKHIYTNEIKKGIDLHRKIDLYTDSHRIVRSSKSLICLKRRRFAGIMIDLFYDHFLAKNWAEYSEIPLFDFSQCVYQALQTNQEILPESLKIILAEMIAQDWLTSYSEVRGIDNALKRIAARIKRTNNLADGVEDLISNSQRLESDFWTFFPDLINYTKNNHCQSDKVNT